MVIINLHSQHWVAESGSAYKFKASLVYNAIWEQPGLCRESPNSNKTKRCLLSLHQNINVLYYSTLKVFTIQVSPTGSLLCINIQNYSYKSEILNKKCFMHLFLIVGTVQVSYFINIAFIVTRINKLWR